MLYTGRCKLKGGFKRMTDTFSSPWIATQSNFHLTQYTARPLGCLGHILAQNDRLRVKSIRRRLNHVVWDDTEIKLSKVGDENHKQKNPIIIKSNLLRLQMPDERHKSKSRRSPDCGEFISPPRRQLKKRASERGSAERTAKRETGEAI